MLLSHTKYFHFSSFFDSPFYGALISFRFFYRFVGFGVLGLAIPSFSCFPMLLRHGLLFFEGFGLRWFLDGRLGDLVACSLRHRFVVLDILFDQKAFD
jgi:hypothetical protein